MIPKNIFQTWKTMSLPGPIQSTIQQMLYLNPTYTYKLFDDTEMTQYIRRNFNEDTNTAYSKLNVGAAKADLWRYLVLYKEGGVYLDIDSVLHGSLDNLIAPGDRAIISRERNPGIFVQWCMMFEPLHPILKITIDKCIYNILHETTTDIMYLTGPRVFSQAVNEVVAPIVGVNVYHQRDNILNGKLTNVCRFYDFDYPGYCKWKHPCCDLLYANSVHWSQDVVKFR